MGDIQPITFDSQASGLDEMSGASPLMANVITDMSGTRKARPGISAWTPFPAAIPNTSPVDGMVAFGDYVAWVTRDRKIWSIDINGSVWSLSSDTATSQLQGDLRPQLFSTRTQVLMVGGGAPQTTDAVTVSSRLAGSPPDSKAIAGIATRIILAPNDTSGTVRYSDPGDDPGHVTWDALNYFEAEARPDVVQTIASNTNELFLFGSETLQVYSPDPLSDFAPGRTLNVGLLAPYSLVDVDDQFAFLDRNRRFVLTDGRGFSDDNVLSKPIESVLRGLTTVSDCWGFRMKTDRWDAVVWLFPTDGRGFIWDRRSGGWSEWRAFGSTGWTTTSITSALHWPEQNVFLVGLSTGQIAKLDATAFTDLGATIKVELVTGFISRGTANRKKCVSAKFVFKRGQTAQSGTAPRVHISWRDNLGPFCTPSVRDLGLAGDYSATVELRSTGVYRQRQWKIEFTDAADFTLVSAHEEFEQLRN
jgi:hypothetical protein